MKLLLELSAWIKERREDDTLEVRKIETTSFVSSNIHGPIKREILKEIFESVSFIRSILILLDFSWYPFQMV